MRARWAVSIGAIFSMALAVAAFAQDKPDKGRGDGEKPAAKTDEHKAAKSDGAKPASEAQTRLEKLKKLAGTWKGTAQFGDEKSDATFVYKVVGAGSAVQESLFVDTPHEMLTVYTVDGDDLVLTHYCAAGNQPFMKAAKGGDANTIQFEFVRAGNMKSDKEMHMHNGKITFVDDDHIKMEWVGYEDGKPSHQAKVELARSKG